MAKSKPKVDDHWVDKCDKEEVLPNRFARTTITKGDPMARATNDYAKKSKGINPIAEMMAALRFR